jgi:hypothetical protein
MSKNSMDVRLSLSKADMAFEPFEVAEDEEKVMTDHVLRC